MEETMEKAIKLKIDIIIYIRVRKCIAKKKCKPYKIKINGKKLLLKFQRASISIKRSWNYIAKQPITA